MANDIILETESLSKHWGGIKALNDISLQFHDRQLHGVVGPNGAV
ncbi:MAG TPA: ABC transporter ATP-binding protein, partial [Marinobacter adhaerens]|nr:ABC transporter ATP-binding protein [Marinobacter adhaerens]